MKTKACKCGGVFVHVGMSTYTAGMYECDKCGAEWDAWYEAETKGLRTMAIWFVVVIVLILIVAASFGRLG